MRHERVPCRGDAVGRWLRQQRRCRAARRALSSAAARIGAKELRAEGRNAAACGFYLAADGDRRPRQEEGILPGRDRRRTHWPVARAWLAPMESHPDEGQGRLGRVQRMSWPGASSGPLHPAGSSTPRGRTAWPLCADHFLAAFLSTFWSLFAPRAREVQIRRSKSRAATRTRFGFNF